MTFQTVFRIFKLPVLLSVVSIACTLLLFIQSIYTSNYLYKIINNAALILFSSAAIVLIYNCIVAVLSRYEQHSPMIFDVIHRGLKVIAALLLLHITISIVDLPKYEDILHKITTITMIVAVTWFCLEIFSILEKISFNRCQQRNGNLRSNYTRIHLLKNMASIFTVIIAISLCCMLFKNVSSIGVSILASAGLMTAVIGFAAQQTISSIFNGIQFAFINPFQIGDVIKIQDDIGLIEEISITHVNLRISESKMLHYPINYFFQNSFQILSSFHMELSLRSRFLLIKVIR